ncbi:NAD(P)-dependent oxidoreductase [Paenibacillus sp. V4I7]|uniref:NAD-dependent epimerase/dehydratase family protein n=1 Tax=Paenibacillus sp. V4I7 TaxID=3042307 RepID=UPI002788F8B6|nr:NAD(P)-dependent oxidoreductase [Paenibacillus sp. V4I7]MDQ0903912.1 UDP-glucose 4-epimerase [Paenibacillus sp. V4I7]
MTYTVMISGANGYFGAIASRYFNEIGWEVLKATRNTKDDIYFDLDHPNDFATLKISKNVDLFIHAAAAHEVTCLEQPYRSIFQNVAGTKAALDFCVANNIEKFVYLSTFHVFGNPYGVIDESTIPLPANDYGLSHLQAEQYVELYTRQNKIVGRILRPSNFFGVPVDFESCNRWSLAPLDFCRQAIENGEIKLNSPGNQIRNFISINDICKIIETLFYSNKGNIITHIPGPETLSIRELALKVKRVFEIQRNSEVKLVIPEGSLEISKFTFNSNYILELYEPLERLEDYIIDFIGVGYVRN